MTERRSRVYWTIRHPTRRTGNPGRTTYSPLLSRQKWMAWTHFTCFSRRSEPLKRKKSELEAEGYEVVKVRIVEEPGQ